MRTRIIGNTLLSVAVVLAVMANPGCKGGEDSTITPPGKSDAANSVSKTVRETETDTGVQVERPEDAVQEPAKTDDWPDGFDSAAFDRASGQLVKKCKDVNARSAGFDGDEVLKKLGRNRMNGDYFRLDDNIGLAKVTDNTPKDMKLDRRRYDFRKRGTAGFVVNKGVANTVADGLRVVYEDGQVLYNPLPGAPLNINSNKLAAIVVGVRHNKGTSMTLGLNDNYAAMGNSAQVRGLVFKTSPDGELHNYIFNIAHDIDRGKIRNLGTINTLGLAVSDVPGDEVVIEYIDFVYKDKFARKKWGVSYQKDGMEVRPCITSVSGVDIRYSLMIPKGKSSFKASLDAIKGWGDLEMSIVVEDGDSVSTPVSYTTPPWRGWHDVSVDLSKYAGRRITLTLRTAGTGNSLGLWGAPMITTTPKERFNVVIYIEDAERADHLSVFGYERDTSPFKKELAAGGAVFTNAFSQSSHTKYSTAALMTGMYPTAIAVWDNKHDMVPDSYLTIAEVLRSQGFATASFVQNPHAGSNNGLQQGFDTLYEDGNRRALVAHLYDGPLFDWMDKNKDRNFFLYVHVINPHGPYEPVSPFDKWYLERKDVLDRPMPRSYLDPQWVNVPTYDNRIDRYDGEILYNDTQFRRFIDKLREMGVYDDTMIVFASDHGDHLYEHGLWNHNPPSFQQVMHIPMIFLFPGRIPAGGVFDQYVQSVDVMPTILDYAGIDMSGMLIEGDSLKSLFEGRDTGFWNDRPAVHDEIFNRNNHEDSRTLGSLLFRRYHYLSTFTLARIDANPGPLNIHPSGSRLLFDRSTDPEEQKDFADDAIKQRMYDVLTAVQAANMKTLHNLDTVSGMKITTDDEVRNKLKALGYVQ